MSPVLDASVLVSALSPDEAHHARARSLFESQPLDTPYVVPALFRLEVISAFARRGESDTFLDAVDALVRGPRFHTVALDADLLDLALRVGRRARLRAYDAVYGALALSRGEALYTLDLEFEQRLADAFPEITVVARA